MNLPNHTSMRTRQHPLLLAAALAVILFCAVGIAAVMGWLPSSHGSNRNGLSDADRAALSASMQQPGANAAGYAAGTQQGAAALPGQAAVAALPGQPVPDAPAPAAAYAASGAPATAYAPVNPVAGTSAYGAGGSQGATGSGDAYATAPATVPAPAPTAYAAPETTREAYPPAAPSPARVAETDSASRWCSNCGNVESIREFTTRSRGSGFGAGAGAILGGLLGHQIGGGSGRSIATVAGAVGGAVVGNQVEGNMHPNRTYEIRVRLDDGHLRTFHQHSAPRWRTGDRVRIVKGSLRTA